MRLARPKERQLTPRFTRAVGYAARLHAKQKRKGTERPYIAREILADYRQVGEAVWNRFTGGKDGMLWYYRALVEAFRAAGSNALVEEFDRVVTELECLAGKNR